ncbi:MAG: hypothetical protein D6683_01530 [Actinomyces sp.]|nr:MAG: hypothetical protein D6683_01530 [Actinomyces sp.]
MRLTFIYRGGSKMRPFSNGHAHSARIEGYVIVIFYDACLVPHAYVYDQTKDVWYACDPAVAFAFIEAEAVDTERLKAVPSSRLTQRCYVSIGQAFRLVAPADVPLDAIARFEIGERLATKRPRTVVAPALMRMRRVAIIGELPYESAHDGVEFVPTAIFHDLASEGDVYRFSDEHVLAATMFLDGFTWTPNRNTVLSKVFADEDRFIVTDGKTTFATHGQVAMLAKAGNVWVTTAVSMNEALRKLSRPFYEWPRRMSWFDTFANRQGIHVIACRLTMYGSTHGHVDALETIKRYATRIKTPYRFNASGNRLDKNACVHIDLDSGAVLFDKKIEA